MKDNSNILIIFDEDTDISSLQNELSKLSPENIGLLPLTSDWSLIDDLKSVVRSLFRDGVEINLMDSAEEINKEVNIIRGKIAKWSADLGNQKIADHSLKKWFLLPKSEVSTWWFSLLSEKNSLKTNVFFWLAQLQAIDKIISSNSFHSCIVSISEKNLRLSIVKICKRHSIKASPLTSLKRKKSIKEKARVFLNRESTFNFALKALIHFAIRILKAIRAKLVLGPKRKRMKISDNSILFVSYFPAVDNKAAKQGIMKNKYAMPLQDKLSEMGKKIIWIWMYWSIYENSFSYALRLSQIFKKKGEVNFFLDEFMSLNVIFRVFSLWIRQFRIFLKLIKLMPTRILHENLSIPEGTVFIKNLMARSFIGWAGLAGILYFELYKEVFSHFPYPSHCIYCLEMQAWERALNAAKQLMTPQIKSIGFQHGALYRNAFSYMIHPNEMLQKGKSGFLPAPDIIACNGDISLHLISHWKHPNITKVEAIRHLHLTDYLRDLGRFKKKDIVLIAGSVNTEETRALISLFYQAFPKSNGFEVWLKGHPTLPFEMILKELGNDIRNSNYVIKHDPVDRLLKTVKILIVGSSAVAVEGLAGGCKVIIPIFSDNMFMSVLHGFEEFYLKVHTPLELRTAIEQSIQCNERKHNLNEIKEFISQYFCLDPSLKRWEELLSAK